MRENFHESRGAVCIAVSVENRNDEIELKTDSVEWQKGDEIYHQEFLELVVESTASAAMRESSLGKTRSPRSRIHSMEGPYECERGLNQPGRTFL